MRRIINHNPLQESNRLVIESIRLQLAKNEAGFHPRRKLMTLPDQHSLQIFRSKRAKKTLQTLLPIQENRESYERRQCFSIPLKINRWQTLEGEQLKKVKSKIQQRKSQNKSEQFFEQSQRKKEILRIGPLIFVKDLLSDGTEIIQKQQRKGINVLKFKALNSLNKAKKARSKDSLDNFTVIPLKISVELPKIKELQAIKYIHKSIQSTPYQSQQKGLAVGKANRRKVKSMKFTDLSPWTTKGQVFNPLDVTE